MIFFFFFQAEDGIRDATVTGVQTCALPISARPVHQCHSCYRPAGPAGRAADHTVLLGPHRRDARLRQTLPGGLRRTHAQRGAGRVQVSIRLLRDRLDGGGTGRLASGSRKRLPIVEGSVSEAALAPGRPRTLEALLAPRSVALVGASDNPARIGGRPLRYLREAGFAGAVYAINPNRKTVQGYPAFPSFAALPEAPDLAILAVPAAATVAALKECVARGTRAAIIFSAGFAETGEEGRAQQDEIGRLAVAGGLRVLGPNCLGVFNAALGYYGTFSAVLDGELMKPGPVAIVSQSGAYGSHLAHLARRRGLGIGHWITTGNEC